MYRTPGATSPTDPELEYLVATLTDSQHEHADGWYDLPDGLGGHVTKLVAITDENSTTLKLEATRPSIWAMIPGVIIFLVGGAILFPEIRRSILTVTEPHIGHMMLGGGICVLGVMTPFYRQIAPGMRQLSIFVSPWVPKFGGGRPGDPQPDGTVNPVKPPKVG